jgi:hypothetical protein
VIATESPVPAHLVVTDTWFPGWHATVDGAAQPIHRANHAFRAVRVPAGRHEVVMTYWPASLAWGLALSAAAAVALGLLAAGPLRLGAALGRPLRRAARGVPGGLLGAAVLLALPAAPVGAATLPAAPVRVSVEPSTLTSGDEARIRVEARDAAAARRSGAYFDIHLIRIPSGPPFLRYLWPTGVWSQTPAPYQRNALLSGLNPLTAAWREEGTPGWISVLVVFASPGADPGDRARWVFQPVMRRLMVRPAPGDTPAAATPIPLGWLATATAGATALVAAVSLFAARPTPSRPRPGAESMS